MLPSLSYHFHLSPADIWALTLDEFDAYAEALGELERAYRKGAR